MRKILLSVSLCLSVWAQAQTYVSSQDMREGYVRQYLKKEKFPSLKDYDIVYFKYEEGLDFRGLSENDSLCSYMQLCPKLRKAGNITLPPSVYVVTIKSWQNTDGAQLFWVKTRSSTSSADAQRIKDTLKSAYKSVTICEGGEAVPVEWFSGDIFTQYQPVLHGGYYMSTYPTQCIHVTDSQDAANSHVTELSKTKGKMYADICDILGTWRHGNTALHANAKFLPPRKRAEGAIHLLSRDLRNVMAKKNAKSDGIKLYNLVLTYDKKGRTMAMPAQSVSLLPEDVVRIKELNTSLKKLPLHSIGDTYTLDGRLYPGVCVDATYDNGLWWMELATPAWR